MVARLQHDMSHLLAGEQEPVHVTDVVAVCGRDRAGAAQLRRAGGDPVVRDAVALLEVSRVGGELAAEGRDDDRLLDADVGALVLAWNPVEPRVAARPASL